MRTLQPSFTFLSVLVAPVVSVGLAAALGCSPATDDTGPVGGTQTPVTPQATQAVTHAAPVSTLPPVTVNTTPVAMNPVVPAGTPTMAAGGAQAGTTPTMAAPVTTPVATPTAAATTAGETLPPKGGTGNDLLPDGKGWVSASTNGVGVQGAFYKLADSKGATATATFEAMKACVKGTIVATKDDMDYDTWGAGMGFDFFAKDNKASPWDGSKYKGVEFTSDATSKAPMMVRVSMSGVKSGEEHFVKLTSGKMSITWAGLAQPDWVTTATKFDPSKILSMQLVTKPDTMLAGDYSICVSGMKIF